MTDSKREITLESYIHHTNDYLLVDIRSETAFHHGHIPDAVSLPEPISMKEINDLKKLYNKNKVLIYCSIGERSKLLLSHQDMANENLYHLIGGYREWLLSDTSTLSKDESIHYSRQMVLPEIGMSGQTKLKHSSVLVIGAGALGTAALTYLASAGVGKIGIVEADIIDRSNLHRQILYSVDDIGKKKAFVAKEKLNKINNHIAITVYDAFASPENIHELISSYDFVIDGTDRIETKFLINDACVLAKIPFCHAGVIGFEGQVMTWTPGPFPCYRCIFEDIPNDYVPTCSQAGIIGALSGIIGCVQAFEAIKYITGVGELLTGKMYHVNGLNMQTKIIPVRHKNPNCKVCGNQVVIDDVKKYANIYTVKGCGTPSSL